MCFFSHELDAVFAEEGNRLICRPFGANIGFANPENVAIPVCLKSGTTCELSNIPKAVQEEFSVGAVETVTFKMYEPSSLNGYGGDHFVFSNKTQVRFCFMTAGKTTLSIIALPDKKRREPIREEAVETAWSPEQEEVSVGAGQLVGAES